MEHTIKVTGALPEVYILEAAGLRRELPVIPIGEHLAIASFVLLGDSEMAVKAAEALAPLLPKADLILTAEAKGIPLVQELSRLLHMPRYVVARKTVKSYMHDEVKLEVKSITTDKVQTLVLDGKDAEFIRGKRILLVDDVISTGESLVALEKLAEAAGASVAAKAAILAEGAAAEREDIIFLEPLPLFTF